MTTLKERICWMVPVAVCFTIGCRGQESDKMSERVAAVDRLDAQPGVSDAPTTAPMESSIRGFARRLDYYKNTWAIVIGINEYGEQWGEPLKSAVNDAVAIDAILRGEFGYDTRTKLVTNDQAGKKAIVDIFEKWLPRSGIGPDDALLVFFAGHGGLEKGTGYLAAADTIKGDLGITGLPIPWLRQTVGNINCRHKAIILDCCSSGSLFAQEGFVTERDEGNSPRVGKAVDRARGEFFADEMHGAEYYLSQPAFLGMSATRLNAAGDVDAHEEHSPFTKHLLRVLKERADSPREDHLFTFRELAVRVATAVENNPNSYQIPEFGYLAPGNGDFIFKQTVDRETPSEVSHRRRVAKLISTGDRLLGGGDQMGALLWYVNALSVDNDDPEDEEVHRMRIKEVTLPDGYSDIRPTKHGLWLSLDNSTKHLEFSQSGKLLATIGAGGKAQLWDTTTGSLVRAWQACKFTGVAIDEDKSAIALSSDDGAVSLWSIDEQQAKWTQTVDGSASHVALDGDGSLLVVCSADLAYLLNAETGGRVATLDHGKQLTMALFSPIDHRIMTIAAGLGVRADAKVWKNTGTRQMLFTLEHEDHVNCAAFSNSGRKAATGGNDGTAVIWDMHAGNRILELEHQGPIECVVFSPDDRLLATTSADQSARIWNTSTGELVLELLHDEAVLKAAFGLGGRILFTATRKRAQIWDVKTAQSVTRPLPSSVNVQEAEFHAGSQKIAGGGGGANIRIWDLAPSEHAIDRLTNLAETFAGRRIDENGNMVDLDLVELKSRLASLGRTSPQELALAVAALWPRANQQVAQQSVRASRTRNLSPQLRANEIENPALQKVLRSIIDDELGRSNLLVRNVRVLDPRKPGNRATGNQTVIPVVFDLVNESAAFYTRSRVLGMRQYYIEALDDIDHIRFKRRRKQAWGGSQLQIPSFVVEAGQRFPVEHELNITGLPAGAYRLYLNVTDGESVTDRALIDVKLTWESGKEVPQASLEVLRSSNTSRLPE